MKWVLASRQQLYRSLGAGETQTNHSRFIIDENSSFLPDGKRVVFAGTELGHKSRVYIQTIGDGASRAITPEGVLGLVALTPDGHFVFGISDKARLYPVDGHDPPRVVPGLATEDGIGAFSRDGRFAFIASSPTHVSLDVFRLDLATGQRTLFKKITPADTVGVFMYSWVVLTPDLKYYAYSYSRTLSELYTAEGLR